MTSPKPPYQTSLLTAQHCAGHVHLILGANPLAAARAASSLSAGAKPILISPISSSSTSSSSPPPPPSPTSPSSTQTPPPSPLHYALESLIAAGSLTHLARPFAEADLFTLGRPEVDSVVDAVFVTTAGSSSSSSPSSTDAAPAVVDAPRLAALCRRHRIPLNVVDAPALCSFSLLSVHADGPLQMGVTTNGSGCKLAGRIRREVAAALPAGLGEACARLGEVRRRVLREDQEKVGRSGGKDGEEKQEEEGVDDSVEQPAGLNRLVLEGDAEAAKTRRMRWLAQVCEYWPLKRLAAITDEDVEGILRSYYPGGGAAGLGSSGHGATGRVILAGSGPGHPDLLTRATYRAIQAADLVLADKLVPSGVLDLIPRRTPVCIARKFPGNADRAQEELLEQALAGVRAGKTVLRLKQGDPFVYGRGGEEVAFFRAHGLGDDRVAVLPGITSSLAAPLFAGIPPTQRDVADQVLVCTGTGKKGKAPQPPEYVESRTVVFLMALHRIDGLVAELTAYTEAEAKRETEEAQAVGQAVEAPAHGRQVKRRSLWPLNTPCAVVERASCPDQRVIRTTLRFVVEAIEQEGSRPPGLLVVGRACEALYTPERGRSWVVEDGFKGLDLDMAGDFGAGGFGIAGMA